MATSVNREGKTDLGPIGKRKRTFSEKLAETGDILAEMVGIKAAGRLMDTPLETLLYDTGPAGQQAVADSFGAAGMAQVGSMPFTRPSGSISAGGARPRKTKAASGVAPDRGEVLLDALSGKKGKAKVGKIAAKNLKQVPDLRNLKTADAIKIAQKEPHLIPSGSRSEGFYVGGPRNVQSRKDLLRMRRDFDAVVAQDPRGADWYDRTRGGISTATGNDPVQNDWMSAQHGQYSAGVSPEGELGFAIKDNNANLMGMPTKAARPAQAEASRRAIRTGDWRDHQLGKKTGQYTGKINPNLKRDSAVGTNDFRHARNFGYTDPQGNPVTNAHGEAQHTFMDYETALAAGRANKKKLGGRTDWNGEKIQAAPWVVQKAGDLFGRQAPGYRKRALEQLGKGAAPEQVEALAREFAFQDANKTVSDYFPKHEAFATYEQVPGAMTGHLPDLVGASEVDRMAYSMDPRGDWNTAPGGRDAIYGGLQLEGTGVAGRVLPSRPMQGMYTPPGGPTEFNPGNVARPLVGFKSGKVKSIDDASRAMLEAGEAVRAYTDAQAAGAAHMPFYGGQRGKSNSLGAIASGPRTPTQMQQMAEIGAKYNLPDIVDTGDGFTVTRFYTDENPEPGPINKKRFEKLANELAAVNPDMKARPAAVDGVYSSFEKEWQKGVGSGAATDKLLDQISKTPEMFKAFDQNPYIGQKALDNLLRDEQFAKAFGGTRVDIQNARRIMAGDGDPRGWATRLMVARKTGAVLPALAGAILVAASQDESGRQQ